MAAVALENVDVAEVLSRKESKEFVEKFEAVLSQDAEAARIMESSTGIEGMYKVVSRYFEMKFEDFKTVCHKAVSYFTEAKARLADDDMDCVVGGGIFDWIKKQWTHVASIVAGVGIAAVGAGLVCAGIVTTAFGAVPVGAVEGVAGLSMCAAGWAAVGGGVNGILEG